jgi:IS5 family transposase
MLFTVFEFSAGELPYASTIRRFRNHLTKAELDQKLLALINSQLEQCDLKVQRARAVIIAATIIPSAACARRHVEAKG